MQPLDHKKLELVFVPKDCPTFSDIIDRVLSDPALSQTRARDMVSGLRRVSKALGRSSADVPADPKWLQPRLQKIAPAALGLTPKSWQNIVSNARAALVSQDIVRSRWRRIDDLSPEWQDLWGRVLASEDKTLPALCRFVHFLSRQGVCPSEVCEAHAEAYHDALLLNEISKSPETAYRAAVNNWNLAAQRIPEWPQVLLTLPRRQKKITLPHGALPSAFHVDLHAFLDRLANPNPLDPHGCQKPLRPDTLEQYRRQILRFASELVHCGVDAASIDSVARLCEPQLAERGLRHMLKGQGDRTTRFIADTAGLLRRIGRVLGAEDDASEKLEDMAHRLKAPTQKGMTRKNRDRLRVFKEAHTLRSLLLLPDRLFAQSERVTQAHSRGLMREEAISIAILLYCPIRAKNLSGIHLEQHIARPGDGRAYLVFDEDDTKTHQPIEFELPASVVRMIDRHLATRAPAMCPGNTPWLFPRRDGSGPVEPGQLSGRLRRRILRDVGIEMNAHLFRHLAVMLWLDANPGAYEAARRLLGHRDVSQTINLYSGLETRSAMAEFSALVTSTKGRLA